MPKMLDETEDLFPELTMNDPQHKAVFAAAKKMYKENSERKTLLGESKKKVDSCREKLVEAMHKAKLERFRFRGIEVEVFPGETRVDVKLTEPEDVDEGDE